MTDLLSFLGAPAIAPTPGAAPTAQAAPTDAFAALLDDVLNQVAVVASAMPNATPGMLAKPAMPTMPTMPTPAMAPILALPVATPKADSADHAASSTGKAVDEVAATVTRASAGLLPMPLPLLKISSATADAPGLPKHSAEAPKAHGADYVASSSDEAVDVIAASVARAALGLPTPLPAPTPAPTLTLVRGLGPAEAPTPPTVGAATDVPAPPTLPTLPAQAHDQAQAPAHAVMPTPPGIARRFGTTTLHLVDEPAPASEADAAETPRAPGAEVSRAVRDVPAPELRLITVPNARESASPTATATATPTLNAPAPTAPAHEQPVSAPAAPATAAPVPAAAGHASAAASLAAAATTATAPTAAPTQLAEREHIHGVGAPLRAAVRTLPKDGKPNTITLTVRLDPPELGAVRVRVVAEGEKVRVTLHAESPEARAALQERQHDVAELLRHDGFSLEGFDIEGRDEQARKDVPEQPRNRNGEQLPAEPEQPQADDNELRL